MAGSSEDYCSGFSILKMLSITITAVYITSEHVMIYSFQQVCPSTNVLLKRALKQSNWHYYSANHLYVTILGHFVL